MSTRTFSEASINIITHLDGVTDGQNGYRQVSLATLSSSSSGEGSDILIAMPEDLHSVHALTFIGFSTKAANDILGRWTSYEKDTDALPDDFQQYFISHIESANTDAWLPRHDWEGVLKNLGMRKDCRAAILDPEYKAIRLTATAKYWAIDTVSTNWLHLTCADQAIQRNYAAISRTTTPTGPATPAIHPLSRKGKGHALSTSQSTLSIATTSKPLVVPPAHTTLFKSGAKIRIEQALIDENFNPLKILSTGPTDFSSSVGLYFAEDRETAELYSKWAARRERYHERREKVILTILVPDALLAGARTVDGWQWDHLVWASRRQQLVSKELRKEGLEKEAILRGEICVCATPEVLHMKFMEQLRKVRRPGTSTFSVQVVFTNSTSWGNLQTACQGKVYLENLGMCTQQKSYS